MFYQTLLLRKRNIETRLALSGPFVVLLFGDG